MKNETTNGIEVTLSNGTVVHRTETHYSDEIMVRLTAVGKDGFRLFDMDLSKKVGKPATINWAGCGSRELDFATDFSAVFCIALGKAMLLNRQP
jgi:hypothetical protein